MAFISGNNLADTFQKRVAAGPGRTAMLRKRQGVWMAVSWQEYEHQVWAAALALRKGGVRPGDRIAILSQTRPEWAFVDMAILSLGAISVPIYPSLTADDVYYILKDCGASVVFVEDSIQRTKLETLWPRLPELRTVISFDTPPATSPSPAYEPWIQEAAQSAEISIELWREEVARLDADLPATVVYTSGTEGAPKGVVLSHANFLALMRDASNRIRVGEQDLTLLFLPVAHIIGRIEQMLSFGVGWTNAYAESTAMLMDNLLEVRPTILFGVPRIYEKIRIGVLGKNQTGRKAKDLLISWAMQAGLNHGRVERSGESSGRLLQVQRAVLDRLLFKRIRDLFGGRLRFAICGGAPLSPEVAEFFHACGVLVLEGYGLTESTGPASLNAPRAYRFGTVGRPLSSVEVRIADDGEILLKGPTLFRGYYGKAVETESSHFEGWFCTGDVGRIDSEGFLHITDRKKDVIITSGGKNIAPVRIENRFRTLPLISNMLVAGDRRNYLTALFTLNVDQVRLFCERKGLVFRGVAELVKTPAFKTHFQSLVDGINRTLPSYEQIKRYNILPRDFSIEAGELTPSLKVKRLFCTRKYAEWIEEMYR